MKFVFRKMVYLKPLLIVLLTVLPGIFANEFSSTLLAFYEILIALALKHLVGEKFIFISIFADIIFSSIFVIIIVQQWVLLFSGGYISPLMIENITSVEALGASLVVYKILFLIILIISFVPVSIRKSRENKAIAKISIYASFVGIAVFGNFFGFNSPLTTLVVTGNVLFAEKKKMKNYSSLSEFDRISLSKKYLKKSNQSGFNFKSAFKKKPNVIIIFTEGMSAEVLDSYNGKNLGLSKNIDNLRKKSLVFNNYFNHTAATYAALKGQLFSMYHYHRNFDHCDGRKGNFFESSLSIILRKSGYHTEFINSEPGNSEFTNYLNSLSFDKVSSGKIKGRCLSDQEFFDCLIKTANSIDSPFFISSYNFGTHAGQDSPDYKYHDGKDPILNKFYNYDRQFGKFWKIFLNSKLATNTVVILTADHATFPTLEYIKALKGTFQCAPVAPIPLFIYYPDLPSKEIDAAGRNSLCLAPTILDLLDINCENYFLGSSLFVKQQSKIENYTSILSDIFYTGDNSVHCFTEQDKKRNQFVVKTIEDSSMMSGN